MMITTHKLPPKFSQLLNNWLFDQEGGLSNDSTDRGGKTNYGISKRAYPELDIQNLTQAEASNIYYHDYWLTSHCDKLPEKIAPLVFDSAVQHGTKNAIIFLQSALRIKRDGIFGKKTKRHAMRAQDEQLIPEYLSYRARFYCQIVRKNPSQAKFIRGWNKRLFLLQKYLMENS